MTVAGNQALAFYRFKKGDYVRCKTEDAAVRYRKPHLRTPGYLFGVVGIIDMVRALQQFHLVGLASARTLSSSSGCGICLAACFVQHGCMPVLRAAASPAPLQDCLGYLETPEIDAFHYVTGPHQPLYRVKFFQRDLWEGYSGKPALRRADLQQCCTLDATALV